ncbi:MAG: 50S ribosomal protein L10 [Clostridia bacterium]
MSSNLESKKLVVEEIKNKISSAKAVAFVDYCGLTVEEATKVRSEFRNNNSEYKVYKNRLVLRALDELGFPGLTLKGTSAVIFGYDDEVTAPRIAMKAAKDTNKLNVLFGVVNGKVETKETIEILAKIPSKEVLIAQLLSVLNGPMRGLACALKAISEKE